MINEIKARIQHSFNKAFNTYDAHSFVQRKICKQLLIQLKEVNFRHENIADFACGTGISTQEIINFFTYENLYAVDFCDKLLASAKNKLASNKVTFILADFDDQIFVPNYFNLLLCNMGFQWALDLKSTMITLFSQLKKSGVIAFSIPLHGTFTELREDCRNQFSSPQFVIDMLKEIGFELASFQEKIFIDKFSSPIQAIWSLKYTGANCSIQNRKKIGLSSVQGIKDQYISNNNITLTYRIGFFIAKKKE